MTDLSSGGTTLAVILAGGTGSRFGGPTPKQLIKLAGQPILHHTLRKFDGLGLSKIVVACNVTWRKEILEICEDALRRTPYILVDGGSDRNGSVKASVEAYSDRDEARVLIHDGVRPLVSAALIERVAKALSSARSVVPVVPSADPLVDVVDGYVSEFGDRRKTFRGQSPQGFWLSDLRGALMHYDQQRDFGFTTVFEAVRSFDPSIETVTVPGELNNIKVTMPVDHLMAGRLLLEE